MNSPLTLGSLCSGYLGLDMAVQSIFNAELRWVSDIDRHAAMWLEKTHPDIPNIGNIALEDWSGVEPVDIVAGGVPCQPYSAAGKQKGEHDPRDLLWIIPLIAGQMGPRLIMLENVARLAKRPEWLALAGELSEVGYDLRWTTLRASDVGACHRRDRLFAIAYPNGGGHGGAQNDPRVGGMAGEDEGQAQERSRSRQESEHRGAADREVDRLMPTPLSTDSNGPGAHGNGGLNLRTVVSSLIPTPTARDWKDGKPNPNVPINSLLGRTVWREDLANVRHHDDTMLPTPQARDTHPTGPNSWQRPMPNIARDELAGVRDLPTPVANHNLHDLAHLKMLPTPLKVHSRISTTTRKSDDFYAGGRTLHDVVYLNAFGEYADAVRRHADITGVMPPHPTDDQDRLAPEFVEWMMMLPPGWVTDPDIGLPRTGQLKMLGNGVVPLQAETAYRYLLSEAFGNIESDADDTEGEA